MRNKTIDIFRGLIMIVMAIDHASFFVIQTHFYEGYDFLYSQHTWLSFLTRFVTHLCAPGFFFALGYGAFKKYDKIGHFNIQLALRGLFLIVLQFTIINWLWANDVIYIGVIFVLGASLIGLNILMPLIKKFGLYIGLILLFLSQYTIQSDLFLSQNTLLNRLFFIPGLHNQIYVLYVITPWLGLACIGAYLASRPTIHYFLLSISLLSLFLVVRFRGGFGNTHPYGEGLLSFFNLTKYPPSLVFMLFTMGLNFGLMGVIDLFKTKKWIQFFIIYGQAPLLFYVLHLGIYKLMGNYIDSDSYLILYTAWAVGVFILYWPCKYLSKKNIKKYIKL